MKLKLKIDRLRRSAPKASIYGQLYAKLAQTKLRYKRVTLHTLFVSDENTMLLRNHMFDKKRAMTAKEWAAFFSKHLRDIHANAVLPGIAIRTNKQWAVKRILGWVGNAKYATNSAPVDRKRNQTK